MSPKITKDQYQELLDVLEENNLNDIVRIFDELTGIVVKPFTAYEFYDAQGNWLGDTIDYGIREILEEADIEITEDGRNDNAST